MPPTLRIALLFVAVAGVSCGSDSSGCDVESAIGRDASRGAIDCGVARNDADLARVNECLANAANNYLPFIVRYERPLDPRFDINAQAFVGTRMRAGYEYHWDTRNPSGTLARRSCGRIAMGVDAKDGSVSVVCDFGDQTFFRTCR